MHLRDCPTFSLNFSDFFSDLEAVGRQWEGSKKEKWRSGKNKRG